MKVYTSNRIADYKNIAGYKHVALWRELNEDEREYYLLNHVTSICVIFTRMCNVMENVAYTWRKPVDGYPEIKILHIDGTSHTMAFELANFLNTLVFLIRKNNKWNTIFEVKHCYKTEATPEVVDKLAEELARRYKEWLKQ